MRQFKRHEEIDLLRKVYGRKFVQVSVHLEASERKKSLSKRIGINNPHLSDAQCSEYADQLIKRDLNERAAEHGQRIEEAFFLGDVFISAKSETSVAQTAKRFVDALFGKNSISPNKDEYGSYIAASAALRSVDTSRQIGAAIFSDHGEIITLGCNEVPAAGGGTYWTDHSDPHRDIDDGGDANYIQKRRIAFDFLKRLKSTEIIATEKSDQELFEAAMENEPIEKSLLMDITEFGRMTHAEMTALTDAARLGRSVKNATIYCTTFPCHNCAKHLIAAGISRVVFIEPYPKSQALELHGDAISLDDDRPDRVRFDYFVGISPRRYRDIFEKGRRRGTDGSIKEWYEDSPMPQIEDRSPSYVQNEEPAIFSVLQKVAAELGISLEDANQ